MTTPIDPVPRRPVKFVTAVDGTEVMVNVKEPGLLKNEAPASILKTVLIRGLIILVVGVFVIMLALGLRQFNPIMMMSMLGFVGMIGGAISGSGGHLFGGGNNPQGEMHLANHEYVTDLREQRVNAHLLGRHIHSTQAAIYPNPAALQWRCGNIRQMWTTTPPDEADQQNDLDDRTYLESAQTNPWGTARIGVGYRRMEPYIQPKADKAPENYDPVQASAYMRFVRTNNVIPDCPVGVDVFRRAFIVCAGDQDRLVPASRAMICSMADNHAPRYLQIGIITPEVQEWDWIKWLPHCADPTRSDQAGPARLHWSSIEEYARDQHHIIQTSPAHSAKRDHLTSGPYRVIFVDIPGQSPDIPAGISTAGLANHTFIYVRHS